MSQAFLLEILLPLLVPLLHEKKILYIDYHLCQISFVTFCSTFSENIPTTWQVLTIFLHLWNWSVCGGEVFVLFLPNKINLTGPNTFNENETIAKYEIMDGAPVRGESIPIRVFLAGYDLTPTMRDINKKFSVRYHLNLVLVDEEERRYFKQQVCHLLLCVIFSKN